MTNHWRQFAGRLILLAGLGTGGVTLNADEVGDRGRQVFDTHRRAVVTVQVVMKTKMSLPGLGGQDNESKSDVTGTVIAPDGLTVIALSSVEPNSLLESIMSGGGMGEMEFKMESEVTDLKILLEDGTEVPAAIVLRDKDLDLAFVRPKSTPGSPMPAVDLSSAGSARVLDEVVSINRLGTAANRAYAATVERISAVVERPRKFYVPASAMAAAAQGAPAFTLDGKVLGMFVMRTVKSAGGGGMFGLNFNPGNFSSIIVPAADIQKVAQQAPKAAEGEAK
jgi:S1-C subfamily serine protease